MKHFLSGVAVAAVSMSIGGTAFAQSTASQLEEEEIIVTGARRDISAPS
ncbi:MAG: hypothetical protein NVV62_17280 [Terricaulis sp.]|nr:hypothetical protein [Terricaulis sp.]